MLTRSPQEVSSATIIVVTGIAATQLASTSKPRSAPLLAVRWAPLALALAVATLLAVRPINSPDIGYHLTYGQQFWQSGQIVDHCPYVYTLPPTTLDPGHRPSAGPGCWYDAAGQYRFANANWLTQVILWPIWQAGGATALCIFAAVLVAATFLMAAAMLVRLGAGPIISAGAILLIAVTSHERLNLRPELLSYLLLSAQLCILVFATRGRLMSWPAIAGLVLLQLLLVNVHSYMMLGLAITGAMLLDQLLRLAWVRLRHSQGDALLKANTICMLCAMAGQIAICFANPWGWRLVSLPVETLLFFRQHNISGGTFDQTGHPWSAIGEFFGPFANGLGGAPAKWAFVAVLAVAAGGMVSSLLRRRWNWCFIIGGMTMMAMAMRRNIAPGALLIVPLAAPAVAEMANRLAFKASEKLPRWLGAAGGWAVAMAAVCLGAAVISQHFYVAQRSPTRFSLGIAQTMVPLGPARWLNEHQPAGTLWVDYDISSNLHFFVQGNPSVPILTNTWAYPPDVMRDVLMASREPQAFDNAATAYDIQTVVLSAKNENKPLLAHLAASPAWALVDLDARYATFVRAGGINSELAAKGRLSPRNFDLAAFRGRLAQVDPASGYALYVGGMTLEYLRWHEQAADLFGDVVAMEPNNHYAWNSLALSLIEQGRLLGSAQRRVLWNKAHDALQRSLFIKPAYEPARINLRALENEMGQ